MNSKIFLVAFLFSFIGITCGKNSAKEEVPAAKGKIEFKLTDDPAYFAYFRIDIAGLEYNTSDNPAITTGWVDIPLQNKGVIDIIQYSNGRELPLGNIDLLPSNVRLLRLKFGTRNVFGIYTTPGYGGNISFFDMTLHPSIANGLVIPFSINVKSNSTSRIYFDFDALKSRIQTGSVTFQLLPSIRVFDASDISAIEGTVLPFEARPYVRVISFTNSSHPPYFDTAYGYPDNSGYFKIIGLSPSKAMPDSIENIQLVEFISRAYHFNPPYQQQEKTVKLIKNTAINTGTTTLIR